MWLRHHHSLCSSLAICLHPARQVTDIDKMCLLIDSLRPDEQREIFSRRGYLNVVNPLFSDRYYRLDLAVWDEREMAKILIRLVSQ